MWGRRLFFTASEDEYRELKVITIIDFQIGCNEMAINANGAYRFCELFGLSMDKDNRVTEEAVDPFQAPALWSVRGAQGVATCTNHSEGFHGRANRKVAGIQCLVRRIATVIDLLTKKHQQFSVPKMNRSAKAMIVKLTESAKRERIEPVSDRSGCPFNCGWDRVYANRFRIPNFPCRHTVLDPRLDIDWDRHGMNLDISGEDFVHEVVVIPYDGANWPLSSGAWREHKMLPLEDSDGFPEIGDAEQFVRRLHAELRVAFPHAHVMSPMRLACEFGRFVTARRSPDDLGLRSRFQLRMFRQYSHG
jgi:hypothetical protein